MQKLASFFCRWLDSKHFRLCRPRGPCCNESTAGEQSGHRRCAGTFAGLSGFIHRVRWWLGSHPQAKVCGPPSWKQYWLWNQNTEPCKKPNTLSKCHFPFPWLTVSHPSRFSQVLTRASLFKGGWLFKESMTSMTMTVFDQTVKHGQKHAGSWLLRFHHCRLSTTGSLTSDPLLL